MSDGRLRESVPPLRSGGMEEANERGRQLMKQPKPAEKPAPVEPQEDPGNG